MPITDFLERNARLYPNDVSLVEINPANQPDKNVSWREYNLIETTTGAKYRREMTWKEFDVKANRFANLLLTRGIRRGDKVAILLMNCLEWLPIYFGILKTGAPPTDSPGCRWRPPCECSPRPDARIRDRWTRSDRSLYRTDAPEIPISNDG